MVPAKIEEMRMLFGVKYGDQEFFHGEDRIWVDFELVHAVYHQDSLDVSIGNIWVLK